MKALILAAGFGTRLLPHTQYLPKPLFPVAGQPLLDITIRYLIEAGITGIVINGHHLYEQITAFINAQNYPIEVITRYEETILGTGGAIRNVSDFLGDQPFLVINSDILTTIDIAAVRAFHQSHPHPATLVMHDYPAFNNVWVNEKETIAAFADKETPVPNRCRCLAFTGIQILDPLIMDFIPESGFVSSIDVYKQMLESEFTLNAFISENHYWRDIGTPESFFEAVYDQTAASAFAKAFGNHPQGPLVRAPIAGDGSDRRWYRVASADRSLILADHGIQSDNSPGEANAFIQIGRHLRRNGIPVPEIYHADLFSGLVYLQDLGDINLQSMVLNESDDKKIIRLYQQVIDRVLQLSIQGAEAFEPAWAYQSPSYDKSLILEKECRYFVEAFLNGYLHMQISYSHLGDEFECLADLALQHAVTGLIHRDLQSRNIMVSNGAIFFIDFQGARTGPVQYDLASLLTDPYVNLPGRIQDALIKYCVNQLKTMTAMDENRFMDGYRYCCITRILQSLGAFGCLTKIKNKPFFEAFIPIALNNLNARLNLPEINPFPLLTATVKNALILLNLTPESPDFLKNQQKGLQ